MNIVSKFFANIRQKLFVMRIEREIYFRIFPHINGEAYNGYDNGIMGVGSMRGGPGALTEIEAGGERKASITFDSGGRVSDTVTYFKWQAELVVNSNFNPHQYDNYRKSMDALPPYCKIETVMLEIPTKR